MKCFDANTAQYQRLRAIAQAAGISEFQLRASVSQYYDKYGTWPPLDYIPNMDSSNYLKQQLAITDQGTTTLQKLEEFISTTDPIEAQQQINKLYQDQEVSIIPYHEDQVIIKIRKKPSIYGEPFTEQIDWIQVLDERGVTKEGRLTPESSVGILNNIINRLTSRYGIKIERFSNEDLEYDVTRLRPIKGLPGIQQANAFIYDGVIYVNTSNAKADAPLHEFMHIIVGHLRETNPQLYQELVLSIEGTTDEDAELYKQKIAILSNDPTYKGRTRNDINEELLVKEFAEFMTLPSYEGMFIQMSSSAKELIFQSITRAIDTFIMPYQSSATIETAEVMEDSIIGLCEKLGSALLIPKNPGTITEYNGTKNRVLANYKQRLINNGELKEVCQ